MGIRNNGFYRQLSLKKGKLWWLRSRLISPSLHHQAHAFLQENQDRLFFILGTGRSGTQLISDLLNATEKAFVFHEPNFDEDVVTLDDLRRNGNKAIRYWKEFRTTEIYKRWSSRNNGELYGEVNGTIRYQVPAIQALYPKAKLFLLTRDGRGVVRSVMGWPQFYGKGSKGAYALSPLPGDPFYEDWARMDRFEKICWVWYETNQFLMQHIPQSSWLQLEQLSSDYDYFSTRFAGQLRLEISRDLWLSKTQQRSRNATKEYGFPHWDDWTAEQKAVFYRICGDTMRKLGYEF